MAETHHAHEGPFEGWENYPRNLFHSKFDIDVNRCFQKLQDDAERLFISPKETSRVDAQGFSLIDGASYKSLQLVDLGMTFGGFFSIGHYYKQEKQSIINPEDLKRFLQSDFSTSVFQIDQEYSWGQLLISKELFQRLLTALRSHPGFLEVVHTFGERVAPVEESFVAFFTTFQPDPLKLRQYSYEIAYNLKYVTRHGRNSPQDPYSIRQTGVYHKYHGGRNTNVWLFLQSPDNLNARLSSTYEHSEACNPVAPFYSHALIFQCLSQDWREYINYLEDRFVQLLDRGVFSSINHLNPEDQIDADFNEIRNLQIMADKLKRIAHILQLNSSIIRQLQAFQNKVAMAYSSEEAIPCLSFHSMTENCIFEMQTHTSRVQTMMQRAEGLGPLIGRVLDTRTAKTALNMNSAMHKLSMQSAYENKLVRTMAARSTKDTRSMKVVALVSSIFLPATFVGTFFGSNFFGFESTDNGHILAMASNVWIYVVFVVVISSAAITAWYFWYSRTPSVANCDVDVESQ